MLRGLWEMYFDAAPAHSEPSELWHHVLWQPQDLPPRPAPHGPAGAADVFKREHLLWVVRGLQRVDPRQMVTEGLRVDDAAGQFGKRARHTNGGPAEKTLPARYHSHRPLATGFFPYHKEGRRNPATFKTTNSESEKRTTSCELRFTLRRTMPPPRPSSPCSTRRRCSQGACSDTSGNTHAPRRPGRAEGCRSRP